MTFFIHDIKVDLVFTLSRCQVESLYNRTSRKPLRGCSLLRFRSHRITTSYTEGWLIPEDELHKNLTISRFTYEK